MLPEVSRRDPRIPVHVLTGFLGSGKTTFLRHLLADPSLKDTAVIINEFGEAGLDHLLVREVTEDVVLLASGCLCCAVRDDLVSALADLMVASAAGDIPTFRQVVVETSGLADPAPIMHAVMSERGLSQHYRPGSIVATLDAVNGDVTLEGHVEAVQQAALADHIVITKTDLVADWRRDTLTGLVRQVNPQAEPFFSRADAMPGAAEVFVESRRDSDDVKLRFAQVPGTHAAHHGKGISTFTIATDGAASWPDFVSWLDLLLTSRGQSILRVKGLLAIHGDPRPVVIQGVQHVLFPPEYLDGWPTGLRKTRLTFIARNLTKSAVEQSLSDLGLAAL